ncbi:hypothetical protein SELMODRAFT_413918 [Selaginella moellendorffii]|uniref:Uncharacterized protein n=1 Tax=Selaginella moellendorffii TaxID=88036 RepID=D8RR17_SELML|nr:hypothetical protein SELMODRAFT_413918 [Selaginella moellendorffii]
MGQNYPIYAVRCGQRIGVFRDWKLVLILGTGSRILYDASSSQGSTIPPTRQPKTTSNLVPITEGKGPAEESDSEGYVTARDASKDEFTDPEGDFGSTKQVESSSSEDGHHIAPKLDSFDPEPKLGAALEAIVITLGETSISQKGTKGCKCL